MTFHCDNYKCRSTGEKVRVEVRNYKHFTRWRANQERYAETFLVYRKDGTTSIVHDNRFHKLYEPVTEKLKIRWLNGEWHCFERNPDRRFVPIYSNGETPAKAYLNYKTQIKRRDNIMRTTKGDQP